MVKVDLGLNCLKFGVFNFEVWRSLDLKMNLFQDLQMWKLLVLSARKLEEWWFSESNMCSVQNCRATFNLINPPEKKNFLRNG